MSDASGPHPDLDQLTAFDQGQLNPERWREVERHVTGCADCCRQLETVADDALVTLLRASAGPAADTCDLTSPASVTPVARRAIRLPAPRCRVEQPALIDLTRQLRGWIPDHVAFMKRLHARRLPGIAAAAPN